MVSRSSLFKFLPTLLLVIGAVGHGNAQTPTATAAYSDLPELGGTFDYTITLENTGTTNIGTFWNCWVPGKNFMAVSPDASTIVSPAGWTDKVTHGGSNDGFAIQWTTTTAPLAPGDSLQFSFESTDPPSDIGGDSVFYPGTPVETSFVYIGAPLVGNGYEFVVIPEPSSVALGGIGVLGVFGWELWEGMGVMGWRRRRGGSS